MKKTLKVTMGVALAASALTPVAAFAAEPTPAKTGFYNIVTGAFVDVPAFKLLTKIEKQELFKSKDVFFASAGQVYKSSDIILLNSTELNDAFDLELDFEVANDVQLTDQGQVLDKDGNVIKPPAADLAVKTVSTTSATTLSVTLSDDSTHEVTLETALVANVATEVTFVIDGNEYSATVTWVAEDVELTVESVSAINATVKKAADQQLGFTINNGKEVTVDELEEAGYTVEFKYNKTALTAADGKIDASDLAFDKFEYQVVVTPEEGDAITSDWKEVKVVDAAAAVKVTKVALVEVGGTTEWKQSVLNGKVTFDAAEYENVLGEKNTDEEEPFVGAKPAVESAASSDLATAYYDGSKIVVLQDGEVTFDVKFVDIEETVKVTVTVKAEQKPASITTETTKVTAAVESTVKFTVLDKDGEVYQGTDKVQVTTKAAGKEESAVDETDLTKGIGEVTHTFAKGETVVTVYADADKKEKLGSFTINAIDTDKNPDKYTLALAEDEKAELDLNVEADQAEVTLDAKAFVEEVAVDLPTGNDYKINVKSSNDNIEATLEDGVVTVKVKDGATVKAGDTANIQLVLKEGSKETKVGDVVTITVKNSTKQVGTLTLKKDTKVKVAKGDTDLKDAVVAAIVEGEGENAVTAEMIDAVTYVASNNAVIVKVGSIYGGKTFTLAAEYVEDATLQSAVYVEAVDGTDAGEDTPAVAAKATIGGVDFEAVTAGLAGNGIKVVIENTIEDATDSSDVDSSVEFANNTLTVTIGAEWDATANSDAGGSVASALSVADLKGLIEANADAKAAIKVTSDAGNASVATDASLEDGADLVPGEEVTEGTAATLTFTFSEAVTVDGDFSFTIGEATEATTGTAVVDADNNKKVVVTLAADVVLEADNTITAITGLKTAKGSVVVPSGETVVKVTVTP